MKCGILLLTLYIASKVIAQFVPFGPRNRRILFHFEKTIVSSYDQAQRNCSQLDAMVGFFPSLFFESFVRDAILNISCKCLF